MRASIPIQDHNQLTLRPRRGEVPQLTRCSRRQCWPPADRSGTDEADRADPIARELDCRDLDIGRESANPQVRARIQSVATGGLRLVPRRKTFLNYSEAVLRVR